MTQNVAVMAGTLLSSRGVTLVRTVLVKVDVGASGMEDIPLRVGSSGRSSTGGREVRSPP
ncbi:hypothetical protein GCM10009868_03740 [Terrabacter aerolatus]|uniref:Uncharacterized protein n=1 Tax=Terrabacter aerolatus TaxID=422442 RepID=A0A512CZG3_9MICO|nr:hypothetical protein TAE01_14130 [Terrabacter aerolatus]